MNGQTGLIRRDVYAAGGLLVLALVIWGWTWGRWSMPFWGVAPEMVFAVGNHYMPTDPQAVYLWLGQLISLFLGPQSGLSLLSLMGGLVGLVGVLYVGHRLTGDGVQTLLCGGVFILFPTAMRQSVVQEPGAVLLGLLVSALAVLLSTYPRRQMVSGVLFGLAVGVHPSALLALPGFLYWMRENDANGMRVWGQAAGIVVGIGWLWLFFQFRSSGQTGTWLGYMLGGIADGYGSLAPGALLSGLMRQIDWHARLFGWGGFVFGALGLLLLAFQDPARFRMLGLLALPFVLYELPRTEPADAGRYVAFLGPVYALSLGTTWRVGAKYLAEGLQESARTMLWVAAAGMLIIQVVCVRYTENAWATGLALRDQNRERLASVQVLARDVQAHTQPEDLVVVIPDPNRPSALGFAPSPWALSWQLQREVVFGTRSEGGWHFEAFASKSSRGWGWMSARVAVDGALLNEWLRAGRQVFSPEPFPLLHSDQVQGWYAGMPASGFAPGQFFTLRPGLPPADDPDRAVLALHTAFDAYVDRGYWTDAAACLEGIIAVLPGDVDSHRKLGDLYMKIGVFKRASEIYKKLLALTPNDGEVAVNLSGALYSQGDIEAAIAVCEAFAARVPDDPDVLFNLAGYYQSDNRLDDARALYERYLSLGDLADKREEAQRLLEELTQP